MYTLRFPFRLPEGRVLSPLDEPASASCVDLSVKLTKHSDGYVLIATPFSDEHAAVAFIPHVYAGLNWTLLQYDLSVEFEMDPQPVYYAEDPQRAAQRLFGAETDVERVDALIDGARPAVILADRKVSVMTAGRPSLTTGVNAIMALTAFAEAAVLPRAEAVIQNQKLRTALDLYNVYFRERTGNARFLTLMMALEALTLSEKKPSYVIDLVKEWIADVRRRKSTLEQTTEEWAAYHALEQEIAHRQEVSVRKKISTMVWKVLSAQGRDSATEAARKAVNLYDKRSRLVHDGYLPDGELREGTRELKEIVRSVLKARFVEVAKGHE